MSPEDKTSLFVRLRIVNVLKKWIELGNKKKKNWDSFLRVYFFFIVVFIVVVITSSEWVRRRRGAEDHLRDVSCEDAHRGRKVFRLGKRSQRHTRKKKAYPPDDVIMTKDDVATHFSPSLLFLLLFSSLWFLFSSNHSRLSFPTLWIIEKAAGEASAGKLAEQSDAGWPERRSSCAYCAEEHQEGTHFPWYLLWWKRSIRRERRRERRKGKFSYLLLSLSLSRYWSAGVCSPADSARTRRLPADHSFGTFPEGVGERRGCIEGAQRHRTHPAVQCGK